MGKIFYASNADKNVAMSLADKYAKAYRKGKCYTPSSRVPNACIFDDVTKLWTCKAKAHHHWGSCGSAELTSDPGRGTQWKVEIPVIKFDKGVSEQEDTTSNEAEDYTDALKEDYEDISAIS